jgi:hypothetical protein
MAEEGDENERRADGHVGNPHALIEAEQPGGDAEE